MTAPYRIAILGHVAMVAAAAFGTLGSFSATAEAASLRGYYEARLEAPLAAQRTAVLSGVAWDCAGDACTAGKANSRPEVVCARLARKLGPLTSFAAKGEALGAEQLARCNRSE